MGGFLSRLRSCEVNIKKQLLISKATKFFHTTRQCSRASTLSGLCKHIKEVIRKENAKKNQSIIGNIRSQKDIGLYGCADNHTVKKEFKPIKLDDESQCICSLEECLISIKTWMDSNRLRMNNGKT